MRGKQGCFFLLLIVLLFFSLVHIFFQSIEILLVLNFFHANVTFKFKQRDQKRRSLTEATSLHFSFIYRLNCNYIAILLNLLFSPLFLNFLSI